MTQIINLNNTTPAADTDNQLLAWKADAPSSDASVKRNVSVQVPKMTATQAGIVPTPPNDGTKFLSGDGTYRSAPTPATMTNTIGGIVPTPPNDATKYLDGTGNFTVPAGSSGSAFQSRQMEVIVYGNKQGGPNELGTVTGPHATGDALTVTAGTLSSAISSSAHGAGTTVVTSGTGAGASISGDNMYRVGRSIKILGKIWLSRTTDTRFIFGVSNGVNDADAPADDFAVFRFSTIASDTHIKCVTGDGTTTTVTDSGISADTNEHNLAIIFDDVTPNVKFYIDGVLVATNTTHLPRSAHDLLYVLLTRGNSSNNTVGFSQIVIDVNY